MYGSVSLIRKIDPFMLGGTLFLGKVREYVFVSFYDLPPVLVVPLAVDKLSPYAGKGRMTVFQFLLKIILFLAFSGAPFPDQHA